MQIQILNGPPTLHHTVSCFKADNMLKTNNARLTVRHASAGVFTGTGAASHSGCCSFSTFFM